MPYVTTDYLQKHGPRLRAMRESAGLSLRQAARLLSDCGVSLAKLEKVEDGDALTLTAPELAEMLRVYGSTIDDLEADLLAYKDDNAVLAAFKAGEMDDAAFMLWIKRDKRMKENERLGE